MAAALVKVVGSAAIGSGSPVITVPASGVALGNHLVAIYGTNGATALTTPGVSDSKSNTWQNDRIHDDATGVLHVSVSSAKVTAALVSGDTITVTPTGGGANRTLDVLEVSGLASASWVDVVNSALATSTAPSSGNLITTQAGDFLVGGVGYNVAPGHTPGITVATMPAEQFDNIIGVSAGKSLAVTCAGLPGAATYTVNGTIASAAWVAVGVAYKAAVTTDIPTSLGTASSTAATTTLVLTTTAAVAVGEFIVVCITKRLNNLSTVTDSAGNTYTIHATSAGQVTGTVHLASAQCTSALASGGTITATFSASGTERLIGAFKITSLDAASWFDTSQISSGTVAAWTSGATATTAQASELLVGVAGWGISGTGSTPGAGYTELFDFILTNSRLTVVYQWVAAAAAYTASGTWSATGTGWSALIGTFKTTTGAAAATPPKPRILQAVAVHRAASW